MTDNRPGGSVVPANPWPLVLCLVGVDYFSTLAYLPSIAVDAAGPLAPVAAGGVVLVTFLLAVPVYWYVVGRSPDGRGATGLLEDLIPGWRGKFVVLAMLGFAAADFVITRSLSVAVAAVHLLHNPTGKRLLERLPESIEVESYGLWPPLEYAVQRLLDPQVAVSLGLSIISFAVWQLLKRGLTRRILLLTAAAVSCYLALSAVVIVSAVVYMARNPEAIQAWRDTLFVVDPLNVHRQVEADHAWLWAWLGIALWSFPQMALGLSGFEMIMTVAPQVSGGAAANSTAGRVRNTRATSCWPPRRSWPCIC